MRTIPCTCLILQSFYTVLTTLWYTLLQDIDTAMKTIRLFLILFTGVFPLCAAGLTDHARARAHMLAPPGSAESIAIAETLPHELVGITFSGRITAEISSPEKIFYDLLIRLDSDFSEYGLDLAAEFMKRRELVLTFKEPYTQSSDDVVRPAPASIAKDLAAMKYPLNHFPAYDPADYHGSRICLLDRAAEVFHQHLLAAGQQNAYEAICSRFRHIIAFCAGICPPPEAIVAQLAQDPFTRIAHIARTAQDPAASKDFLIYGPQALARINALRPREQQMILQHNSPHFEVPLEQRCRVTADLLAIPIKLEGQLRETLEKAEIQKGERISVGAPTRHFVPQTHMLGIEIKDAFNKIFDEIHRAYNMAMLTLKAAAPAPCHAPLACDSCQ